MFSAPLPPFPRAPLLGMHIARCFFSLLFCVTTGCYPSERGEPRALEVELSGPPSEDVAPSLLGPFHRTLYERLEQLREVAESDQYRGLLLRVSEFGGGFARSRELARALARIRKAGKPVHCYFDATDNSGYALLASGCERISMPPSGVLNLVGVRAQAFYARELLERVGVTAELMHVGRFKGAADNLTRTTMPEHTRLTLSHLGEHLQSGVSGMIERGRSLSGDEVAAAFAAGPLTANAALKRRLVDDVAYADEAREHLRRKAQVEHVEQDAPQEEKLDLGSIIDELVESPEVSPGRHVTLVPIVGTIGAGGGLGGGLDPERFVREMRKLGDDDDVAAVVLRIDSPGGSAMASDLMWHAVVELDKKKPVIASVGDMAASGGYYIACGARKLFAEPTSVIGSIGVVGGKIQFSELTKRLGVNIETLRMAPNAGWSSPTSPFTDSERAAVQQMLQSTYHLFLRRVSAGREIPAEELAPLAEGRVMHAQSALEHKLIDRLGGLVDALNAARKAGGLAMDSKVMVWPERDSALEELVGLGRAQIAAPRPSLQTLADMLAAQSDVPLLQVLAAEQVIAATLPYGLLIR